MDYPISTTKLRLTPKQYRALIQRLRDLARMNFNSGDEFNTEPPMVTWDELNELADVMSSAADALESAR